MSILKRRKHRTPSGVDLREIRLHVGSMQGAHSLKNLIERRMPTALDLLKRMVAINSYTENPEGVTRLARLTAECFEPLGFAAEFVPSTNPAFGQHLILTRPGRSSRNIVMVSHLDTVFPEAEEVRNNFAWQEEGDRIYGPGTMDIKGGTVMMWLVLSALTEHAPDIFNEITWQCFWNASEERLTLDMAELCRRRINEQTLAALVFEAEGRAAKNKHLLVVARKGRATWRITVSGRGAHAGVRHSHGANAVVQLGKTIQKVAALTDYSKDLTFNVGTISGGVVGNRVPHEALAEGEFRAFSPEIYLHGKNALLALAGPGEIGSAVDNFKCKVEVEILNETAPWARNEQTDRLFEMWKQAGAELGLQFGPEERAGLSDGNLVHDAIATLDGLGPWGDNDHCSERTADGSKLPEFVEISSFVPKVMVNVSAILALIEGTRATSQNA